MTDGVGKALASAMKDPVPAMPEKRRGHIFRNRHRRAVFSSLTMRPCVGVAALARDCGVSQNTVKWHLESLLKAGYVAKHLVGKRGLFFPEGLIGHADAALFHSVNHPRHGKVYGIVHGTPGLSQSDITAAEGETRQTVAKSLTALEAEGLVSILEDGTHSRYYPTGLLQVNAENFYRRSRDFSEYIIRRLEREAGKPPTIVKRSLDRVLVEMGHASDRFTMEIGINPFMTCNVW